jgi:SPP1 gp7 family putative phage head morphogenesis protein
MRKIKQLDDIKKIQVNIQKFSTSGIEIYSGNFSEEYLASLQGTKRAETFDKMRRSDSRVKMILSAVKNPIKSAAYEWQAYEGLEDHAEFLTDILLNNVESWKQTVNEFLSMIEFGHVVFEMTHKLNLSHKKWGDFYSADFGWISPKTIDRWNLDKATDKLKSIFQRAYGDNARAVEVPAEVLCVVTVDREGSNYEGISMLRPAFGAWKRKDVYLKLMAVGTEKNAIKTPVIKVPAGKEGSPEFAKMTEAVSAYTSHECAYITVPEGWELTLFDGDFKPEEVVAAIKFENSEMAYAFLANFLELGMNGTGSYALSNDLSDFFLGGITYLAEMMCDAVNKIGQNLIDLKFGPQEGYPKLKASGIADKVGLEWGNLLKALSDSKYIIPDEPLEVHIRRRLGLPEPDIETSRGNSPVNPPTPSDDMDNKNGNNKPGNSNGKSVEPKVDEDAPKKDAEKLSTCLCGAQFASSVAGKQIERDGTGLNEIMKKNLRLMRDKSLDTIRTLYKKSSENEKILIPSKLIESGSTGVNAYKSEIEKQLIDTANGAIDQVKSELKTKRDVRASQILGVQLAKKLPKNLSNRIKSQSTLISSTTASDLDKIIAFVFGDSLESTADIEIILKDIKNATEKQIEGQSIETAAVNATSRIVNEARNSMFFDEEVRKEISSLTFVNDDPVSQICKDLAGTTFDPDDPESQRYFPPLHHNCKSTLKANLVRNGKGPELKEGGLRPSSPDLEKFITLSEPLTKEEN